MPVKLSILGGSSPFTVSLVDALAEVEGLLPQFEVSLFGRNQQSLNQILAYAKDHLGTEGWQISATTDLRASLSGADFVLHQIRYGGMHLRGEMEYFCAGLGIEEDETLGPAALLTALVTRTQLEEICETVIDECPEAVLLNLTNPLSYVTQVLATFGVKNCFGLCELPMHTMTLIANHLGVTPRRLDWAYSGLNHRGFIHNIYLDKKPLLAELVRRLGTRTIEGIRAEEIADVGAVPLKYFAKVIRSSAAKPGRAAFLDNLRDKISDELESAPGQPPMALQERYMEWYSGCVVPILVALTNEEPSLQVLNILGEDGVVWERRAYMSKTQISWVDEPAPPPAVMQWINLFEKYERCFWQAVNDPTPANIATAVECDPLVPDALKEKTVDAMLKYYEGYRERKSETKTVKG